MQPILLYAIVRIIYYFIYDILQINFAHANVLKEKLKPHSISECDQSVYDIYKWIRADKRPKLNRHTVLLYRACVYDLLNRYKITYRTL